MDNDIRAFTELCRSRKKTVGIGLTLALLVAGAAFSRFQTRSAIELTTSDLVDAGGNLTCNDIHKSIDKCSFARSYCGSVQPGRFNYIAAYYCTGSPFLSYGLAIWLISLFMVIGIAAYDFLCPNLNTFSKLIGFPDTLAGVTLLAFGNGSPDLFTTYSAMTSGSGSLAVGELLGAAVFITMIVAGSMSIIKPFTVPRSIFLRDIGFFIVAMMLSLWFISDGAIRLTESIAMFALYVTYVFMVVGWHYYHKSKNQFNSQITSARESMNSRLRAARGSSWPSSYADIQEYERSPLLPHDNESYGEFSHIMREVRRHRFGSHHLIQRDSREGSFPLDSESNEHFPAIRPSLVSAVEFSDAIEHLKYRQLLHANSEERLGSNQLSPFSASYSPALLTVPNVSSNALSPMSGPHSSLDNLEGALSQEQDIRENGSKYRIIETICPSFVNFFQKSFLGMVMSIITAPFVFLLTISIPVFETDISPDTAIFNQVSVEPSSISHTEQIDGEDDKFGTPRWLLRVQLIVAPLIVSILHLLSQGTFLDYSAVSTCLMISAILLILLEQIIPTNLEPSIKNQRLRILSIAGFIMSIIWIAAVADEVVSLLRFIGIVYNISEEILGLTIFAFGNSLGDLVANVTIAQTGNPEMAFSACFGGPLLNILVGIGLSSICIITGSDSPTQRKAYHIEISSNLIVAGSTLLLSSVLLYIAVPLNGWRMNRTIGCIIIALWIMSTLLNIVLEVRSHGL